MVSTLSAAMAVQDPPRRIGAAALSHLLDGWAETGGPYYESIAERLRDLIALGELPAGTRLPSERELSRRLALSRTTVVAAYDRLRDEGHLRSRRGSGTWVPGAPPDSASHIDLSEGTARLQPFLATGAQARTVDLATAALPGTPEVTDAALSPDRETLARLVAGDGYQPLGLDELREAIAVWHTERGLPTTRAQILVTTGAQQALDLAFRSLLQPGDGVVVEDPTFRGAILSLHTHGADVIGVPSGPDGIDLEALEGVLATRRVSLIYVIATAHNPTGSVLSTPSRRRLVNAARRAGVPILEDAAIAELIHEPPAPRPLAAFADDGQDAPVLTVSSLSKSLWGGLRVGWLRGPEPLIAHVGHVKGAADIGSAMPSQLIALTLLERYDDIVTRRRSLLRDRLDRLERLVGEALPDWSWTSPKAGSSLWVQLPGGEASRFAEVARRAGVRVIPGPIFSPDEGQDDRLRLPFVARGGELSAGVSRLAHAWQWFTVRADAH